VLSETPIEELDAKLSPLLDIDETLWFLAIENALINSDGYWIRASDYNIYLDSAGVFHLVPHDMNESFRRAGGPGMGRGNRGGGGRGPRGGGPEGAGPPPGGAADRPPPGEARAGRGGAQGGGGTGGASGVEVDPLIGGDDASKPLRSRLLAVPRLREQYLANVRAIAEHSLDWNTLGPRVAAYRALFRDALAKETRSVESIDGFDRATSEAVPQAGGETPAPGRQPGMSLRAFADARRKFLLGYEPAKSAAHGESGEAETAH
jgi:hypothetical protein